MKKIQIEQHKSKFLRKNFMIYDDREAHAFTFSPL